MQNARVTVKTCKPKSIGQKRKTKQTLIYDICTTIYVRLKWSWNRSIIRIANAIISYFLSEFCRWGKLAQGDVSCNTKEEFILDRKVRYASVK